MGALVLLLVVVACCGLPLLLVAGRSLWSHSREQQPEGTLERKPWLTSVHGVAPDMDRREDGTPRGKN